MKEVSYRAHRESPSGRCALTTYDHREAIEAAAENAARSGAPFIVIRRDRLPFPQERTILTAYADGSMRDGNGALIRSATV